MFIHKIQEFPVFMANWRQTRQVADVRHPWEVSWIVAVGWVAAFVLHIHTLQFVTNVYPLRRKRKKSRRRPGPISSTAIIQKHVGQGNNHKQVLMQKFKNARSLNSYYRTDGLSTNSNRIPFSQLKLIAISNSLSELANTMDKGSPALASCLHKINNFHILRKTIYSKWNIKK